MEKRIKKDKKSDRRVEKGEKIDSGIKDKNDRQLSKEWIRRIHLGD